MKRKKLKKIKLGERQNQTNTGSPGVSLLPPGVDTGDSSVDFGTKTQTTEVGSSGTEIIGGFYKEEFIADLQGRRAAEAFDQMRRREAVVAMLLDAIKNPIKAANWTVEIEDEADPVQLKMKRLVEWNLFHGLEEGWEQLLTEILTFIDFGYSVFEAVHATKPVPELAGWDTPENDPYEEADTDVSDPDAASEGTGEAKLAEMGMGADAEDPADVASEAGDPDAEAEEGPAPTVTCYDRLGFRKQTSIWRWFLDRKTGKLLSIQQILHGDVAKQTIVDIPGAFCLVFTNKKEGDNFEGISALRPMYGSYLRKDLYLRLTAIGAEKNAVGTVIGTVPAGKANSEEESTFEAVLEAYAGNELSYLKKPEGWGVEIQFGQFDPQKMVTLLNFENEEMAKSVIANFLNLGTGGNSGSLAVGGTLSNFFLNGIQAFAAVVCGTINRQAIPALCKLNFGEQKCYPKLRCTGINDKAGKELADIVLTLTQAQALTADSKLEDFLRSQYKLPKVDPASARKKPAPMLPGVDPNNPQDGSASGEPGSGSQKAAGPKPSNDAPGKSSPSNAVKAAETAARRMLLADRYLKHFDANKANLLKLMQQHLKGFRDDLKDQLRKNWNSLGDHKAEATKGVGVSPGLVQAYKRDLREYMATVATQAIAQARSEAPAAAKKVKFGDYDKLNPVVRKNIEQQLSLTADSQKADMEKVVLFQFASSDSQTSLDGVLLDVDEKLGDLLDGSGVGGGINLDAAAGDTVGHVTQDSRNAFFFAPDVLETIESFTFTNEDPITEICQNLNGQVFRADDPNAEQFYPPLHHNCKSRLVPNGPGEAKVTGIGINADSTDERARLEKQITLGCGCC